MLFVGKLALSSFFLVTARDTHAIGLALQHAKHVMQKATEWQQQQQASGNWMSIVDLF